MICTVRVPLLLAASLILLSALGPNAAAQNARRGGWMRAFLQPPVAIAQLEEVQKELKLTAEQIELVKTINDELNQGRRELFQSAGDDRQRMREELTKLTSEATERLNKELEEPQQKRLHEVYLQVNGAAVLQDAKVAEALKITDDQKQKLAEAREQLGNAGGGLRDLSEEERATRFAEFVKKRDEALLAVLTDEQRADLDKMKGAKLEVDLSKMPRPGR